MKKSILAVMITSLVVAVAGFALPARADEGDITFNRIFAMADKNKDSMITKAEFLDAMGKAYDMKMAKMKASPGTDKMVKGSAMTMDGFKSLINDIHHGA